MRGPVVGLVIGLVIGAGAMYLVLRPPWGGGGSPAPSDAGVISSAPTDAGVAKKQKKGRRGGGNRTGGTTMAGGSDEELVDDGPELVQVSAADLATQHRGTASLPPGKIDMGGSGEARSLTQDEINFVVSTQTGAVRDCVVRAATNTTIHGATVKLTLAVDGTGKIVSHAVDAPKYMLEHGLYDCTTRAVAKMHFPAVGGGTLVDFPVTLN